ncbi:glycosyltransferase family 2 protein [Lachnospiraceae bacterium JLR.KK008]
MKEEQEMKMEKLVSVIVPMYNEELRIGRCIRSILCQTYDRIELLLINDGSTDRTEEICKAITDPRVFYYSISNRGAAQARNYGLQKATGEYVLFVDGDDYIDREMIRTLATAMERSGADLAKCRYAAIYAGDKVSYSSDLSEVVVYDLRQALNEMNYSRTITPSVWDALFKRAVLEGVSFPSDVRIGEDYTFLVSVLMRAERVVVVPDILYYYVQNGDSVTHRGYTEDSERILENYIDVYHAISCKYPDLEQGAFAYLLLQEMAIIVSMIMSEQYDSRMIRKIQWNVRSGLKKYIADGQVPLYLKCCAILIAAWPGLFILIYKIVFKQARDMQVIKRAKETCA